jgi:hypothetical protein
MNISQGHFLKVMVCDNNAKKRNTNYYGVDAEEMDDSELEQAIKRVKLENGAVGTPSMSFENDTDTGLYLDTDMKVAVGGTNTATFGASATTLDSDLVVQDTHQALIPDGTQAAPGLAFKDQTGVGLYRSGNNTRLAAGNVDIFDFGNSIVGKHTSAYPIAVDANGTLATPAYILGTGGNSGLYMTASPDIKIALAGADLLTLVTTTSTLASNLRVNAGSDSSAALQLNDQNTGLYSTGAGDVSVTANGTRVLECNEDYIHSDVQPLFCVGSGGTQVVATSIDVTIDGAWTIPSTNRGFTSWLSGVLTIAHTGTYMISAQVAFASNATGQRSTYISLNGSGTGANRLGYQFLDATSSGRTIFTTCFICELSATDTIELIVFQNSGGNLNVGSASTTAHTKFNVSMIV